ncbi:MAG: AMP-binding protein, partial [Bacteroidota bacterium]
MGIAAPFETIPEMLLHVTSLYRTDARPAMMAREGGALRSVSYARLRETVEAYAAGFASLGLGRGDRFAILSENRPEWAFADLGGTSLGGVCVPLYPSLTADQIGPIVRDAGVSLAVASSRTHLEKLLHVASGGGRIRRVVLLQEGVSGGEGFTGREAFLEGARGFLAGGAFRLAEAAAHVRPDDLLTLIYTSGTTGTPKGVMLTHRNLASNIRSAASVLDIRPGDRFLSWLPLSHSFERMAGYYTALACGATIAYAGGIETLREDMTAVRPNIMTAVPRLFERMQARILRTVEEGSPLRRAVFHWAIRAGLEYHAARRAGSPT